MKHSPFIDCLIFFCAIFVIAGCNLFTRGKPANTSPSTQAVKVDPTKVSLPDTPQPPPSPVKSKLHWGKYTCITDCISDQFLEDYQVIGGVPPLKWWESSMTITVSQDGSISNGSAFFWIGTDSNESKACTRGEYKFSEETTTGSYDESANLLSVDMTGEESFAPLSGGPDCSGASLVQQATKHFTFAVDEEGHLLLCKPEETGEACLNNPMALLK